jgi:Na+/H+-dicarboxylate symporter
MKWWFRRPLHVQISAGIAIGILLGLALGPRAAALRPIGDIFLRLLTMLIVPLTFFTLLSGLTRLESIRSLRTLGGSILLYYAASSLIAAAVGLGVALLVNPGRSASGLLGPVEPAAETARFSLVDNLVSWVPGNPIESLAQGNLLQVIIFTLILGAGLLALGKKAERLVRLAQDGAELMIVVTELVMKFSPYGILALVANMVGSMGPKMLAEVGRFVAADVLSMIIIFTVLYALVLRFIGRLSPLRFYRHAAPAVLVAGSTTSSGAALPAAMTVADKAMGIPEKIWAFTLPLGATINQNGMAASLSVVGVFAANLHGLALTPALLFQFVFLGLVLSSGTAGVKGSGVVVSSILLQTLHLPLALVPILAAVWPVIDIGHTICNVTGDLVGTAVVSSRMKTLDRTVFDGSAKPVKPGG